MKLIDIILTILFVLVVYLALVKVNLVFEFKRNFEYYKAYKKSKKNHNNYHLLNEFKFIKTTGTHINQGLFFYKNINVKIKKKFQNHFIFNIIKESLNV